MEKIMMKSMVKDCVMKIVQNKGGENSNKPVDKTGGTFESSSKSDPSDRVSEGSSYGYSKSDDDIDIRERQQQGSLAEGILNERNDNSSPANEGIQTSGMMSDDTSFTLQGFVDSMREEDSSLSRNGNLTGNDRQSEIVEGKDAAAVEEQQIEGTVDVNLGTQVEDVAVDLEKALQKDVDAPNLFMVILVKGFTLYVCSLILQYKGHYELLSCFNNTATFLQNNCVGTESVEEDQLSQDKGDDNVGMEDEDIASELERNLEQVSYTHMIDLEPLPSGPSNEKIKRAQKPKKRKEKIPIAAFDENQLEAPNPKKKKGILDSDAGNENIRKLMKPKKTKGNPDSDAAKENLTQVPKPTKRKCTLDCDAPNENLKQSPKLKKSKEIVQGEPNDNLKRSPKSKKSKDIVQGADPNEKIKKPNNGNTTKVVTLRKSSRLSSK
ncbi:hypothetical protein LWI29_026472 [Acer saccharum]|uniref:Uncharacterized protein n=1 Tax=Acer saccharum TaxID=4024 RepID=A0AA39RRN8_ACESA|nr:hypothetical protein LWI29_026472 [Acer saccharum]